MTLTFKFDLDILSLDLHAKNQDRMSVRLVRIVRRTHKLTHSHTHDVKTITPSADAGCKNVDPNFYGLALVFHAVKLSLIKHSSTLGFQTCLILGIISIKQSYDGSVYNH